MAHGRIIPPKLAKRFLLSFLRHDLIEEVLGDLDEQFYVTLCTKSRHRARLNYWFQVLHYLRPFALKRLRSSYINNNVMLRNYFKIGWRNLFKNKGYSFINIGGLACGIAVAMVIGLWVYDELSFNKYHKNHDRIATVMLRATVNGETRTGRHMPFPLGPELSQSFKSDFEHVVMSTFTDVHIIANGDVKFTEFGNYMEPDAPKMLTLEMIFGTYDGLRDLNTIMLSQSLAERLFGDEEPMNKIVKIDNKRDVKVTGIYRDLPKNSQFNDVHFIAPWELYIASNDWAKQYLHSWNNSMNQVFVQMAASANIDVVSQKIKNVIQDHARVDDNVHDIHAFLHPMSRWHLYDEFKNGENSGGQIRFVWLFGIIGFFVLLLACINFMNLSTARSERRAKEVGIRKAVGSVRTQLITQFFSESFLVVFLSFVLSLLFVILALPLFNEIANKQLNILWTNKMFWFSCIAFAVITGIIAGSYPALYLSSFRAVKVLKGTFRAGRFASLPRKILVVCQFTVSVSLIIGTIVVHQQIQHTKNRPVGYDREGLLYIDMKTSDIHDHFTAVRNQLLQSGAVVEMAESNSSVIKYSANHSDLDWKGKDPDFFYHFAIEWVGPEYGKTVGWHFTHGRDFSRDIKSDLDGIVINEAAAKYMGLENPVGEVVKWQDRNYTVLGVVKDMIVESPYKSTRAAIYMPLGWYGSSVLLKINPEVSTAHALEKIQNAWKQYVPGMPFEYKFASEEYAKKFSTEVRIGKLSSVFAVVAILISCLGLFGLASFVTEQRTKEIGIRKIVGASLYDVWRMLTSDFVVLVLISFGVAIPIASYFLSSWLQQYEYRTEISWWIFAATGMGSLLITLLTVSFQAVKAAMMNPVKSLRSE
jgi:ABC-type antimicrobial peptide transport system permease subunit